jgi:hypothetical protein
MLKKIGFVTTGVAAGLMMMSGMASAQGDPEVNSQDPANTGQVGLVNLNNTDVLHNVNAVIGVCDNYINVLGVQVNVHDVLEGNSLPLLSPGAASEATSVDTCATGGIQDGGTFQGTDSSGD